jgi:hypothetical protein
MTNYGEPSETKLETELSIVQYFGFRGFYRVADQLLNASSWTRLQGQMP